MPIVVWCHNTEISASSRIDSGPGQDRSCFNAHIMGSNVRSRQVPGFSTLSLFRIQARIDQTKIEQDRAARTKDGKNFLLAPKEKKITIADANDRLVLL